MSPREEMNGLGPIAPRVQLGEFEARYKTPSPPSRLQVFRNVMATSAAMARATVYFFDADAFDIYIQQVPRTLKPTPGNSIPSERALEVGPESDSISLGARMDDCSVCGVWRLLGAAGTCIDCTIARENADIAALRTRRRTMPECTCDRDPLGVCLVVDHQCDTNCETCAAILADCLKELPDQRLYRVVFGLCLTCGSGDESGDSEECWTCYDKRMADAEMFARHAG